MSAYLDNKSVFYEPQIHQVASRVVTTNVVKPLQKLLLNIDTQFQDDYDSTVPTNCRRTVTLPERITGIKTAKITHLEIPFSFYNMSIPLNNTTLVIRDNLGAQTVYTIPNGFYTSDSLTTYLTAHAPHPTVAYQSSSTYFSRFVFTPSGGITTVVIEFAVSADGFADNNRIQQKLGWALGFRKQEYTLTALVTTMTSEAMVFPSGQSYVYVVVEDFAQSSSKCVVAPLNRQLLSGQILARASISDLLKTATFGRTLLSFNEKDGNLKSAVRVHRDLTSWARLQVDLVNEFGQSLSLNGLNYSFFVELEYE
jgi:hypothetical protein